MDSFEHVGSVWCFVNLHLSDIVKIKVFCGCPLSRNSLMCVWMFSLLHFNVFFRCYLQKLLDGESTEVYWAQSNNDLHKSQLPWQHFFPWHSWHICAITRTTHVGKQCCCCTVFSFLLFSEFLSWTVKCGSPDVFAYASSPARASAVSPASQSCVPPLAFVACCVCKPSSWGPSPGLCLASYMQPHPASAGEKTVHFEQQQAEVKITHETAAYEASLFYGLKPIIIRFLMALRGALRPKIKHVPTEK